MVAKADRSGSSPFYNEKSMNIQSEAYEAIKDIGPGFQLHRGSSLRYLPIEVTPLRTRREQVLERVREFSRSVSVIDNPIPDDAEIWVGLHGGVYVRWGRCDIGLGFQDL